MQILAIPSLLVKVCDPHTSTSRRPHARLPALLAVLLAVLVSHTARAHGSAAAGPHEDFLRIGNNRHGLLASLAFDQVLVAVRLSVRLLAASMDDAHFVFRGIDGRGGKSRTVVNPDSRLLNASGQ